MLVGFWKYNFSSLLLFLLRGCYLPYHSVVCVCWTHDNDDDLHIPKIGQSQENNPAYERQWMKQQQQLTMFAASTVETIRAGTLVVAGASSSVEAAPWAEWRRTRYAHCVSIPLAVLPAAKPRTAERSLPCSNWNWKSATRGRINFYKGETSMKELSELIRTWKGHVFSLLTI
jgi:hypothetical protein